MVIYHCKNMPTAERPNRDRGDAEMVVTVRTILKSLFSAPFVTVKAAK